jgi:GT2 family glycosyltransferase
MHERRVNVSGVGALPRVSIILVNWNGLAQTRVALRSIAQHTTCSHEIIVVDNGSTRDESAALLPVEFPDVRFILNADNRGFSAACNQGIAISQADYVLLLNNDTIQIEDAISSAASYLDQHPEVGVLGIRHLNDDEQRTHQVSVHPFPEPFREAQSLLGLGGKSNGCAAEASDVDWVCGSFFMVPRRCLDEVGPLDERYFVYEEDMDWCRRAWERGFRVRYWDGASIIHQGSATKHLIQDKTFMHLRSHLTYLAKHHSTLETLAFYSALSTRLTAGALVQSARALTGSAPPALALERWQRLGRFLSVSPTRDGLKGNP